LKYSALWQATLFPLFQEVMMNEWTEANATIGINTAFQVWDPESNKYIRDNISRVAKEVDEFTKNEIFEMIEVWNDLWLWADDIAGQISEKFEDFKKVRSLRIARTEITRASNEATERAYIESWVVEGKEWLAELDDRTSDICQALNWKQVFLWEDFAKKWDIVWWVVLDYEDLPHCPAHVNCRSTIIPILK
jgi:hypothetical protein